MTKQRQTVLDVVRQADAHMTADEIWAAARRRLPHIVQATVYNSLNYLTAQGLIRRVRILGQPDRYDRVLTRHDHLICDRCGRIKDTDLGDVKAKLARQTGLQVTGYELTVHYICDDCLKETAAAKGSVIRKKKGA